MSFTADLPKIPGTYRHRWIDIDQELRNLADAMLRAREASND